jgi:hypothetical protein
MESSEKQFALKPPAFRKMKKIDLTGHVPIIGSKKQNWLFRCESCGYEAVFTLWRHDGMSTACEICGGDMERVREIKMDESKIENQKLPEDYEWLRGKIRAGEIKPDDEFFLFTCDDLIIAYRGDMLPVYNGDFWDSLFEWV